MMILRRIIPRVSLAPYIDSMWVFEHDFGVPVTDSRVVAPNALAKFIYSYANPLSTVDNGCRTDYPEQNVYLIGIWDRPVTLVSESRYTGTIGVELTPNGLHRFTRMPASEITNRVCSFEDIYGNVGRETVRQLNDIPEVWKKVECLQDFLERIVMMTDRQNTLVDYSVAAIRTSGGLLTVNELVRKTGYSRRYLDLLFKDHLGIPPKTLAGITRFQTFYRRWANEGERDFYRDGIYDLYYDQAHFIKEFKKFTGHAPAGYARLQNEFGKIFYR